ncbi:hypothetical protein J7E82_14440 [Arthrobacter sp. ISL-30]|nr:hypothetical protein [Arthrobacter sp. ISL-30]
MVVENDEDEDADDLSEEGAGIRAERSAVLEAASSINLAVVTLHSGKTAKYSEQPGVYAAGSSWFSRLVGV